jgi:hypothetical protein
VVAVVTTSLILKTAKDRQAPADGREQAAVAVAVTVTAVTLLLVLVVEDSLVEAVRDRAALVELAT